MASLRDNIPNHRAINIGDIFKDADAKPNIKEKDKLSTLIEEIVSNGDGINYSKDNFEFLQTKKFITNLILPEVKKYSYSDLPSISETSQSTNFGNPTKISRENRNILPKNIKYFFIDAAMNPKDYKNKDLTEEQVVETFASYMDPASRSNPTETLCNELSFEKIYLNKYGFKNGCYVKLLEGSKKDIMYIEICLNNLLLQCKIDRYGKIKDENFFFTIDGGIAIPYYDIVKKIFFKGNLEKNKYINENIHSTDNNKKYISIMLLLLKELGDTMQAIILEQILKRAKTADSELRNYLGNSCLLTNDTVLATRCSMLSVPFLLKHNFILTSYQPPISDADRDRILKAHDENQKLQETERIILNNDSVIKTLQEFLKKTINNKEIENIKLSKQTGVPLPLQNKPSILLYIEELIKKIENANVKLNYILNIIKNDLKSVTLKLKGINPQKIYNKEDENKIIEICKGEFNIFRTYIYQLNAIKLFKKIENSSSRDTILTECYISTTKTSLFKTKIPNNLHGDTSNIDTDFSLINEDENEIFEQGFMKKLEDIINPRGGGSSEKKKKISNSISYEEIYIKVYPYIYCYPWFIEYILDTKNNEIIDIFLQELIEKDKVEKTLLDRIFSRSNEDEYYELSLYNNIHDDKKNNLKEKFNFSKKGRNLLQKFRIYIMLMFKENTNTNIKSLSLPRKSNKVTLRKTKSLPNQRLTRKRDLERQTALPGKEKTPKRAKKLTAKRSKSSETPEQKTAKRAKKLTAKKITTKRGRSSETLEQNIAPESPKSPKK